MFVAAPSSCHLLAVAARKKLVGDASHDEAVGVPEKDAGGRLAITRVSPWPEVTSGGEETPGAEGLRRLRNQALQACFIANSVNTPEAVEPQGWG